MIVNMPGEAFDLFYRYYDLFYQDKDYVKEGNYVAELLLRNNPETETIIELGSGTGNYSGVLCKHGFSVTGIERNEQMVSLARSKSISGFTALSGDIVSFELNTLFDAAVSLFHVISYLTSNEEVISCLKQTSKHLKSKGIFVFDVWYTPAVYNQMPHTRVKRIETDELYITRLAEPTIFHQENIVELGYRLFVERKPSGNCETVCELHRLRHFSTPEIKLFAHIAGFTLLGSEEFFTAKVPGLDTWGVCYILQKND